MKSARNGAQVKEDVGPGDVLIDLAWMIDGINTGGEYSRTEVRERTW